MAAANKYMSLMLVFRCWLMGETAAPIRGLVMEKSQQFVVARLIRTDVSVDSPTRLCEGLCVTSSSPVRSLCHTTCFYAPVR